MAKNYVRLDRVHAQDYYDNFVAKTPVVNGQFLNLGISSEDHGIDTFEAVPTPEGTKPDVLATTVFIDYGELNFEITDQVLEVGKVGRGLVPHEGQIVSFNVENAQGVAPGDLVEVGENGLGVRKHDTGEAIGIVIREDYLANIGDLVVVKFK